MSRLRLHARWLLLLLALAGSLLSTGCTTPDDQNLSSRPWAAPRSWESGLPASILEGR